MHQEPSFVQAAVDLLRPLLRPARVLDDTLVPAKAPGAMPPGWDLPDVPLLLANVGDRALAIAAKESAWIEAEEWTAGMYLLTPANGFRVLWTTPVATEWSDTYGGGLDGFRPCGSRKILTLPSRRDEAAKATWHAITASLANRIGTTPGDGVIDDLLNAAKERMGAGFDYSNSMIGGWPLWMQQGSAAFRDHESGLSFEYLLRIGGEINVNVFRCHERPELLGGIWDDT